MLGLRDHCSKVVQKHGCRLTADVSFAKSSEHLREMLGVRLAAETLRQVAQGARSVDGSVPAEG